MDELERRVAKCGTERAQSEKATRQGYRDGRRQYHGELHAQIDEVIKQIVKTLDAADWPDAEIIRLGFFRLKKVVARRFNYINEYDTITLSFGTTTYFVGRDGNLYADFVDFELGRLSGASKVNYRKAAHASTLRELLMSLRHLQKSL